MIKHIIQQTLLFFFPLMRKFMPFSVFAYLSVGAANTILNIGLFAICFRLFNHPDLLLKFGFNFENIGLELATIISFSITLCTGFWMSKNFAFTESSDMKYEQTKQFGKYALVSFQGQLSDYFITKALIVLLFIEPILSYFISTIIMLVINYFLQKYFTFRASTPRISPKNKLEI
jgi:putative flippase GtrA